MSAESVQRVEKSYCRICQAFCGMKVTIAGDRIVRVHGDRDDPVSRGYACFKGLQAVEQHYGQGRLRSSLRRSNGSLVPGSSAEILAQAGARLAAVVAEHGPESVGFFIGTQALFNTLAAPAIGAFAAALGTPRVFTTMTIDQSAKWIGEARLGGWQAGPQAFCNADVWMFIGGNPLVSMVAGAGASQFAFTDPVRTVKAARERGLKLIVVDPRRSETARFADLFVQIKPGHDGEFAASVLHVILREGWHDAAFCAEYVDGLEALRAAVAPFAPQACAQVMGIAPDEIERVAALFARDSRSGMVGSGTGPDMARHSNVAEHLIQAINVVCGRFPRAGAPVINAGVLGPEVIPQANVLPPNREWEQGPRTRKHGLGRIKGTMMSAEIASEILHPGTDRLRALICVGGNLAVALPDQARAEEALAAVDLLIVIDPRLSATARFADFVIAPKVQYERPDHTGYLGRMFQVPFAHATAALVPPPRGADVVDEWYALWSLARSMGIGLQLAGEPLSMAQAPDTEALLALLAKGSRVPLSDVLAAGAGGLFPGQPATIGPRSTETRFQLLPGEVAAEVAALAAELAHAALAPAAASRARFLLTVRRHRELMNSTGADLQATWSRLGGNPAYMHPDDMAALDLQRGDRIEIFRGGASIGARVAPDAALRSGVLAIGHGWPGLASQPWQATNALVDAEVGVQAINRMPIMTGMTVEVRASETC